MCLTGEQDACSIEMRRNMGNSMKRYGKIIIVLVLFMCSILTACIERVLTGQLASQQLASRWSREGNFAQVSCFFSGDAGMTGDRIMLLEYRIQTALAEVAADEISESGRSWVCACSAQGELTVFSGRARATVRAFGVSGDFFLFHPLELLSGNYLNAEDLNGDGVILDENVAWQLFGSCNVSGMTIEIGDTAYIVCGVVRSDDGLFSEAAGEGVPTIYVSYPVLERQMGSSIGIDSYELLIVNPAEEFGVRTLESALGLPGESYELVENSARFDLRHRFGLLKSFGIRSMVPKEIRYPCWENRARAYEDVSALLLVLELLFLCYPVCVLGWWIRGLWRRRRALLEKIAEIRIFLQ